MFFRSNLISFTGVLSLVSAASCYVAPSTNSTLQSVLTRAKLQYPTSELSATSTELYNGFAAAHFQLIEGRYMQLQVAGASRRSELRQMEKFGSEEYWAVDDGETHISKGSIMVPAQEDGIEEVTIMQIHGGPAPILRISWVSSIKIDGTEYEDVIISTIRVGLGSSSDQFIKNVLTERYDAFLTYRIEAVDSKLSIKVDGQTKVDNVDVSFWDGDASNYFKAGAYNNHPSDSSATARVLFNSLSW
uniref:Alginate lyase n=1 Tax=Paradendryphiella salina TaxID=179392 RepID=A0A7I9C7R9_9PLEO|nr:Alginate lyase [Paradendryphiella salina]